MLNKKVTGWVLASCFAMMASSASAYELEGKVDCIVPSDPGGGLDFTCRSVGKVMEEIDLVPGSVQVTNMPGAGNGVAYAHVVSKREGDENLIVAASSAATTRLAQGQFPGMTADMVNWVGALGADYGVLAVGKDSPYKDLNSLMEAMDQNPRNVKFSGGSSKGGWDHLKALITAKEANVDELAKVPYLSYNNGGEALTQVVGGHVDAFTGDLSEAQGFWESGDLRILAVLAPERLPGKFSDIPTAKEQGIDAVGANWRGFYVPKGISNEAKQYWVDAIDTLYASDEWKKVMKNNGLMPFHMSGDEFEQYVDDEIKRITELSQEIGLIK